MESERLYVTERELRAVDRVLRMKDGYVLDFSDRTFAHFFDDYDVDIDHERYQAGGTSKANRLRTFLRLTPPPLSGRVLQSLLEHRDEMRSSRSVSGYDTPDDLKPSDRRAYLALIERLNSGGSSVAAPVTAPAPPPSLISTSVVLVPPPLRARLTNGEDPQFDHRNAPWDGLLPDVETVEPDVFHDVVAEGIDVLLLTAVPIERDAMLRLMKPFRDRARIAEAPVGHLTYYVGAIGAAHVVLTMSRTGSIGRDASILTLFEAMQACAPRSVVAVGIAFGGFTDRLKIGDVLVSNRVVSYEPARKQPGGDRPRGSQFEPGPLLLNRFRNVLGWRFERPDGTLCSLVEGQLLSGEKLVDDLDFKEELFTQYLESIGGEMEGAGVAAAAEKKKVEWIVVKAVSDWGDGTKGDRHRPLAAAAAASLVAYVVSPRAALADLPKQEPPRAQVRTKPEPSPANPKPPPPPLSTAAPDPFRWREVPLGNIYNVIDTKARLVLRHADAREAATGPVSIPPTYRMIEVFPASVPSTVIEPASLARLTEAIEIRVGGSDVFPFRFHETRGVSVDKGRSWHYPAEVRRDFVVGYDGSILFREALWEEILPPVPPHRIGNELNGCFTAVRAIAAVRFMQQLLQHFSGQSARYEIIIRFNGMNGKRLYFDDPNSVLFPFVAQEVCAQQQVVVGATFVPDLTRKETLEMVTKLFEQVATLFNVPGMTDALMAQVRKNLGW